MLTIAILCHFPPSWFENYGVRFDPAPVQDEIDRAAFSTVEGILCRGLAARAEMRFHVITFSKAVTRRQEVALGGSSILHVLPARPMTGMPVGWLPRNWEIQATLKKLAPDVVHGFRNIEGYGSFAVKSRFPHVVTPQEFLGSIPAPWKMKVPYYIAERTEAATLRDARNLVAITPYVEEWLRPRAPHARIFRIPNIAEASFYQVTKPAEPEGVLFVGRIAREKGLLDLLGALRIAAERGHQIKLDVVGGASGVDGQSYLQECRDFAARHLPADRVTFHGWLSSDEIARLHSRCAVFAMPSTAPYETMGVVLAESLAAGTPAVVYDFGPLPHVIQHGRTGLAVPAGDIPALAEALIRLLSDVPLREQMSRNAREAAKAYMDTAVVEAHLEAYEAIAGSV